MAKRKTLAVKGEHTVTSSANKILKPPKPRFTKALIRRLVLSDEEFGRMTAVMPTLFSRAMDLFIQDLALQAHSVAGHPKRLERDHVYVQAFRVFWLACFSCCFVFVLLTALVLCFVVSQRLFRLPPS
jgi:hypothetical protein